MAKDYAEKLAKGGRSIVIIFIIGVILGYGLRIFISRRLSVEEFGLFYSILSIVGAFTIFKELGLLSSIAIKIPEFLHSGKSGKIKTIIKKSLLIQFTAALIIGTALIYLSSIILPSLQPSSITVLQIIALSFIASVFFEIFRAGLQGLGDINFYTAVEPLRLSIIFAASFVLFSLGLGMVGLAIAYLAAAIILAIIVPIYFWLKHKELLKTPSIKVSRDEFAKFTAIIWMGSLLSAILSYADTILLAFLRAPKEAGFYQVALPTSQLLTFFLYPIMIMLVPFVSEM